MIHITKSNRVPVGLADFPEMVERKGKGHPDSVADECAEACSRALTKYYIENFDTYFHHNVDKAAYVAGQAAPEFGGGKILQPQEFEIIGRAIDQAIVGGKLVPIPVRTICRSAIQDVFKYTFRNIDLEKHVIIDARTKSGSIDLTGLYNQERNGQDHIPLANDTSFGVGFAPFSSTDQMVYDVETYLNSSKFKDLCPASGEDIKVMGLRNGKDIEITLCNAMVSKYVNDSAKATEANTDVALTGHMVKAVSDNRFVFSDGTGELFVTVDGDKVNTAALANHEIDVNGMIVGDFMYTEVQADSIVVHN